MKSIFKLGIVVGLLLTMTMGMAKEPKMKFITAGKTKSLVFELDSQSRRTSIQLMDEKDHIIFSDNVSSGIYVKKFDLTALRDGIYFMITENAIKAFIYTIQTGDGEIGIIKKEEKAKPIFRKNGNRLFLNLLNLDAKAVDIKVYDSHSRILFKETVEGEVVIGKVFNFKDAHEDRYMVVVKDKDDVYYEYVVVN